MNALVSLLHLFALMPPDFCPIRVILNNNFFPPLAWRNVEEEEDWNDGCSFWSIVRSTFDRANILENLFRIIGIFYFPLKSIPIFTKEIGERSGSGARFFCIKIELDFFVSVSVANYFCLR